MMLFYDKKVKEVQAILDVIYDDLHARKVYKLGEGLDKDMRDVLTFFLGSEAVYELNGKLITFSIDEWFCVLESEDEELLNQVDTLIKERLKKAS